MNKLVFASSVALFSLAFAVPDANAQKCANGVYVAGCAGPNGVVGGAKPKPVQPIYGKPVPKPPLVVGQPRYKTPVVVGAKPPPAPVQCVNGKYVAGCVGPNGAVMVNK